VAGVMAPLEHCFRPDLAPPVDEARVEHAEIAELLANAGVDLLLLESMNALAEAEVAVEAARATGLPVWVSFVVGADGNVLSGESLVDARQSMSALGVEALLVNCAPPDDIQLALERLCVDGADDLPIGACAHLGWFDPPSWKFEFFPQFAGTEAWSPQRYAPPAAHWHAQGARIVGRGSGPGPAPIRPTAP